MKTSLPTILALILIFVGVFSLNIKPLAQLEISTEWNAARAQRDIENGNIKLLSIGFSIPCLDFEKLTRKYGFNYKELGCVPPMGKEGLGIDEYNAAVKAYLTELHGKGWENKLYAEIDSANNHNPCFN